ncbi:MAG: ABC transporter ATP-binding protein/permease [Burkholderiaceae bacterium]
MAASSSRQAPPMAERGSSHRRDWRALARLLPYLSRHRWRIVVALLCMAGAKAATVGVPILLKSIVDGLDPARLGAAEVLVVPVALVLVYGLLRFSSTLLTELREMVFAPVTAAAMRSAALEVFRHLHGLSLRFHLERQTGGLTSDIERGTRAISTLVSYTLYSIVPTLIEISLVIGYLVVNYDVRFALITVAALLAYALFTVSVTEWRTHFRRSMNRLDADANSRAVDSLLNYETVKYFVNERLEAARYDEALASYQRARLRSQFSLGLLNVGQALIISSAVAGMIWLATAGVVSGEMTLGDLVLVNGFMIQLYIPLNFLGTLYREIRQNLTDLERMLGLLDAHREIDDAPGASDWQPVRDAAGVPAAPRLRFEHVQFAYRPDRPILQDVDFTIEAGTTTAVVGASGAGKSTLARLLFRFYDVTGGAIRIDDADIRSLSQQSLRSAIGVVPQDTVLFNETIGYNIGYGRPEAGPAEIRAALEAAQLGPFVDSLPQGLDTPVGERGLKLSGGEKQRVAIARMLLKNPPILVLDEATSALDSRNEQAIQAALEALAAQRTTLVIAHRLSTVVNADQILVMREGRVVERGTHAALLAADGVYAAMWRLQQNSGSIAGDSSAGDADGGNRHRDGRFPFGAAG